VDATNINDGDTEPLGLDIKEDDSSSSTSNDVTHDEELSANPPTTRPLWEHQEATCNKWIGWGSIRHQEDMFTVSRSSSCIHCHYCGFADLP
jgi:hypothetical protein